MNFIQWLGVKVPKDIQDDILCATSPVERSIEILCQHLESILQECASLNIPLGINCESVSIFKAEIDGVHELFRRLQGILLTHRGSPWTVTWMDVVPPPNTYDDENSETDNTAVSPLQAALAGAIVGGVLVAGGVVLGTNRKLLR